MTAPDGEIDIQYGRSATVHVYTDKDGNLRWNVEGDTLSPSQAKVHYRFEMLRLRISQCLPLRLNKLFRDRLSHSLFHAFCEADEARACAYFDQIQLEVEAAALYHARLQFVAASSCASLGVVAVCATTAYLSASGTQEIAIAAGAGAAGAWASALQRAWGLQLMPHETHRHLVLQAATRAAIGPLFSIVALVAMKVGILLPTAADGLWSVALVGFIAGFSERLVPDLIARIESLPERTEPAATTALDDPE